jgi:hypothetical protein
MNFYCCADYLFRQFITHCFSSVTSVAYVAKTAISP